MTDTTTAGAFPLGDRAVNRMGYGAMQPPRSNTCVRTSRRRSSRCRAMRSSG